MYKKVLILPLIIVFHAAFAQQKKIDSLKHLLTTPIDDTLKIRYHYELGRLYPNRPDSALTYIAKGLRLAQAFGSNYYIACGKYAYATAYARQGNYPLSIKNIFETLNLIAGLQVPTLTVQCYQELAAVYDDQNDDQKAVQYIQLALPIARKIGNKANLISLYNFISYFYNRLNHPERALSYDNMANELAEQLRNDAVSGHVYASMGKTYLKLQKPEIGLPFLNKAIVLLIKAEDQMWLLNCYTYMSDYYMAEGPADSAMVYSLKELTHARTTGYQAGIMDAMKKLGALNDGHDQARATQYYKNALALNEQLFNSEKTRAFQNLVIADEQQKREQAEQKRIAEEERKENLQLVAIALFIPVFLMLVLLLSRTKLHRGMIDFMGVLSLLLAFEFITLLVHPVIERITHHTPILELIILVIIAAVLVPLHHQLTHWLKQRLARRVPKSLKKANTTAV